MSEVRRLTAAGVHGFETYLESCRAGGNHAPPFHLLTDPLTSEGCQPMVVIHPPQFGTRYDFGEWLLGALGQFEPTALSRDAGIWSWIGLYFFDQTSPAKPDGTRTPGENARHILPGEYNYRKYYRHLAREAWLAVRINGEAIKPLFLGALDRRGEVLEQFSSRLDLFGNPRIMEAAVKLYVDPAGKQKKLASSKKGGSPRRLAALARQLALTYDLRSSSADQLVGLLPAEFTSA